jgi:pimeloyl-ACP methyl ester carboxylesterase
MQRATVADTILEYEVAGTGAPVVFIHGAFIADAFRPLVAAPDLAGRYRLITYHRRGYTSGSRPQGPVSTARQAADCLALLGQLGVAHAHVVGHSFGGAIALQLAQDSPAFVHSLVLLEPALMVGASGQAYRESLMRGGERYREAGAAVVADEFLQARWPGYRESLEQVLPGGFAQAVANAQATFELDIGFVDWRFGEPEARRLTQPALVVLGGKSEALWPRFGETHRLLLDWLPRAEGFVLPYATHFLHLETPHAAAVLAEKLAGFFARHRLVPSEVAKP